MIDNSRLVVAAWRKDKKKIPQERHAAELPDSGGIFIKAQPAATTSTRIRLNI